MATVITYALIKEVDIIPIFRNHKEIEVQSIFGTLPFHLMRDFEIFVIFVAILKDRRSRNLMVYRSRSIATTYRRETHERSKRKPGGHRPQVRRYRIRRSGSCLPVISYDTRSAIFIDCDLPLVGRNYITGRSNFLVQEVLTLFQIVDFDQSLFIRRLNLNFIASRIRRGIAILIRQGEIGS